MSTKKSVEIQKEKLKMRILNFLQDEYDVSRFNETAFFEHISLEPIANPVRYGARCPRYACDYFYPDQDCADCVFLESNDCFDSHDFKRFRWLTVRYFELCNPQCRYDEEWGVVSK